MDTEPWELKTEGTERCFLFLCLRVFHPSSEGQREDFKHGIPLSLNSLPVSVQLCVRFFLLNLR